MSIFTSSTMPTSLQNEYLHFPQVGAVEVVRIKRKDIELQVLPAGQCRVRAPLDLSLVELSALVEKRLTWLEAKQAISTLNARRPKEYVTGESFWFQGDEHGLDLVNHGRRSNLVFDGRRFLLLPSAAAEGKKWFTQFYKREAREIVGKQVEKLSARLGYRPSSVKILELGARWGSCSKAGGVNFNWKLAMLPPRIVEYLIVHELTHLDIPIHSAEFWKRVEVTYPEYRQAESWLREHGSRTTL